MLLSNKDRYEEMKSNLSMAFGVLGNGKSGRAYYTHLLVVLCTDSALLIDSSMEIFPSSKVVHRSLLLCISPMQLHLASFVSPSGLLLRIVESFYLPLLKILIP